MKTNKNVTDQISFGESDGESLFITKCICGKEFSTWEFCINIYDDNPNSCPKCGRKFFWRQLVTVFEVVGEENNVQI